VKKIFPTEREKRFGKVGESGGAQKKLKWIYTKGVEATTYRMEMNPQTIIKKMNEYVDEPLDFDDFDWDGFLNWDKVKEFDDLDEFCDWCVSTLEEDGFINWEGHLD